MRGELPTSESEASSLVNRPKGHQLSQLDGTITITIKVWFRHDAVFAGSFRCNSASQRINSDQVVSTLVNSVQIHSLQVISGTNTVYNGSLRFNYGPFRSHLGRAFMAHPGRTFAMHILFKMTP